jgi:hypothetical protein
MHLLLRSSTPAQQVELTPGPVKRVRFGRGTAPPPRGRTPWRWCRSAPRPSPSGTAAAPALEHPGPGRRLLPSAQPGWAQSPHACVRLQGESYSEVHRRVEGRLCLLDCSMQHVPAAKQRYNAHRVPLPLPPLPALPSLARCGVRCCCCCCPCCCPGGVYMWPLRSEPLPRAKGDRAWLGPDTTLPPLGTDASCADSDSARQQNTFQRPHWQAWQEYRGHVRCNGRV